MVFFFHRVYSTIHYTGSCVCVLLHIQRISLRCYVASMFVRNPRNTDTTPFLTTTTRMVCSSSVQPTDVAASSYSVFGGYLRNIDSWPSLSQCACWHCTEMFTTPPVPIVTKKLGKGTAAQWEVTGNFCSFNCAKRWLLDRVNCKTGTKIMWLEELARNVFQRDSNTPILTAPPMITLKKFGGNLTIEEFRQHHETGREVRVIEPPFISYPHVFEGLNEADDSTPGIASGKISGLRRPSNRVSQRNMRGERTKEGLYSKFLRQESSSAASSPSEEDLEGSSQNQAATSTSSSSSSSSSSTGSSSSSSSSVRKSTRRNTATGVTKNRKKSRGLGTYLKSAQQQKG